MHPSLICAPLIHNICKPNDELRARYRYLDLRRTPLADNLKKRSQVAQIVRRVLSENGLYISPLAPTPQTLFDRFYRGRDTSPP